MLTVLVHANSTPGALAATLSALVPAVAEGLVSHAIVMLEKPDQNCERIADAMGATLFIVPDPPWQPAAKFARSAWVMLLQAGDVPDHGWVGVAERHLMVQSQASRRAALLPLAHGLAAWRERTACWLRPGALRAGLIVARDKVVTGSCGEAPVRLQVRRQTTAMS